mgnify:CR=1 FL=1
MEIVILILCIIGAIWIFKVLIPAIKMTNAQIRDLGDKSGYLKYEDLEVKSVRNKHAKDFLIKKYLNRGFTKHESNLLAEKELQDYLKTHEKEI